MIVLMAVAVLGTDMFRSFIERPPGDFYTETGSNYLQDGRYEDALADFDKALKEAPRHRGAMMGRALVFTQMGRHEDAEAEYTAVIRHLEETLAPDDRTGRGALYAAYANRGIIKDRQNRFREALADYIEAIKIDQELAETGPGWLNRFLYYDERRPSTVLDRANYLYEQLRLPEEERGPLRIPELDERQRMYKP